MPTSPLAEFHRSAGARFTDFGGWDMPVQYESVLAEHRAVREGTGVFDVTHLGRFALGGAGSTELLRTLLCNDVAMIEPGRAQYTMMLNEAGGVVDDIIVWRLDTEDYWVLPNGVNQERVIADARAFASPSVSIESTQDSTVLLAIQGPDSRKILEGLVEWPGRFRVRRSEVVDGAWVAGTGYTGESGVEVAIPVDLAAGFWSAVVAAGATPCGLGARDTLRLEMGYPLWGQDLSESTNPLEAGLSWVVSWDHEFVGKDALIDIREAGVARQLESFVLPGRQIARHGARLRSGSSQGEVTSGNFSPTLGRAIGLGYLGPPIGASDVVEVEIRGTWVAVERTDLPFVTK